MGRDHTRVGGTTDAFLTHKNMMTISGTHIHSTQVHHHTQIDLLCLFCQTYDDHHPGTPPHPSCQWSVNMSCQYHVKHILKQCNLDRLKSGLKKDTNETSTCCFGFWFLVCYTTTQLANQLYQTRIQVVHSNKLALKRLTNLNGTPAMDLGHMNVFSFSI